MKIIQFMLLAIFLIIAFLSKKEMKKIVDNYSSDNIAVQFVIVFIIFIMSILFAIISFGLIIM